MARRRSARHARPTGRGALEAAYADLEADVARMRSASYADSLELIRLSAMVNGLVAQITRLVPELTAVRQELQAVRAAPPPTPQSDAYLALLTSQVSELRATVATQQAMLSELTGRTLDLLTLVDQQAAAAAPAPAASPAPAPAPQPPPAPTPVAAPVPVPQSAYAMASASSAPVSRVDLASRPEPAPDRVSGHVPAADDALDDETVRRLRLIREASGR